MIKSSLHFLYPMPEYRVFCLSLFYNGNGYISHTFALELKKKEVYFSIRTTEIKRKRVFGFIEQVASDGLRRVSMQQT